ncbi:MULTISPECIES: helix-turn-helix domain-containing protein [unclassified Phyllobacterium]|uniref:helix-turn-helix domain-containing protein n=1 Tax=unclassified Phyllobacterium TaxID=2638441 RepID=UPI003012CE9C
MSMKINENKQTDFDAKYDREIMKAAFASMFWSVLSSKKASGYKLQDLARALGRHKSAVSRWFGSTSPNWEISTVSDIANALDVDIQIHAVCRNTGKIFGPSGEVKSTSTIASTQVISEGTSAKPTMRVYA